MGVWNIGYVMIAYGVSDASCSLIIGRLVKFTGFIPWFILSMTESRKLSFRIGHYYLNSGVVGPVIDKLSLKLPFI